MDTRETIEHLTTADALAQYAREASIALGHLRSEASSNAQFYLKIGDQYYANAELAGTIIQDLKDQLVRKDKKWREVLKAEHDLSDAYIRLRMLIPGAMNVPEGMSPEEMWAHTEEKLRVALEWTMTNPGGPNGQ